MVYATADALATMNRDDPTALNHLIRESLERVLVGSPLDGDQQVPVFNAPPSSPQTVPGCCTLPQPQLNQIGERGPGFRWVC